MPSLPPPPESISGATLDMVLREGPGTVVFSARDGLGLPLEVHLFHGETLSSRIPKEIFFDEVRRAAALHSERLAAVINAGEKGPWYFVVLKSSEGASLAQIFSRGGGMDEARALTLFASVAEGLSTLELAGLRHGGLDGPSVRLPGSGQVLIGLRRMVPLDLSARDPASLAPEEARGQDGSIASDLFSLGMLLLQALHGAPPLTGTGAEVRTRLSRGDLPDPGTLLDHAHPATVDVLRALLAVNPSDRPRTAADAAARLRAAASALTSGGTVPTAMAAPVAAPVAAPIAAAPVPAMPRAVAAPVVPSLTPASRAAPAPPAPAAPAVGLPRARRAVARLVFRRRDTPVVHELLDPITWLGFGEGALPVARAENFPGAAAQVEIGGSAVYLFPTGTPPAPKVNGEVFQRHDLRYGDRISVGGHEFLYEKAERLSEDAVGASSIRRVHSGSRGKPALVAGVLLCAVVFGWGVLRFVSAASLRRDEYGAALDRERKAETALAALPPGARGGAAVPRDREQQALGLLKDARALQESGDIEGARARLMAVLKEYPGSAAAAAAALHEIGTAAAAVRSGGESLADLLAKAESAAADGRVTEAVDMLRSFARGQGETLVGDRAERAADGIIATATDHVNALLETSRRSTEAQDWTGALAAVKEAFRFAVGDAVDRVREERDRVFRLKPRTSPTETGDGASDGNSPVPGSGDEPPPRPPSTTERPGEKTPPPAGGRDEEAAALFRASREALEGNRPGEAERGFYRLLTEYTDTPAVRNYGDEIRQRMSDAFKKGRGVAALLQGGVQFQDKKIVLTYEFENERELEDWELDRPFAVANKGTFAIAQGELEGRGAASLLLRPEFLPGTVSMSFRIRPGIPAQDMGAMMVEPKEFSNHLMFTIGNQFFTIGKGAKETKLPGNVIFVFGKGMWRDTDPGLVGFVRTGVSEDPSVPSGRWTEVEVLKDKGQARFTLGGKAISGKSVGDNKYELTGIRPALFVLLSEARFDEVTVEGEIDPAWAAKEHARVFPPK